MKYVFNPFTGAFDTIENIAEYVSNYLPLSGGTLTGLLSSTDKIFVSGGEAIVTNTTVSPNASAVTNIVTVTEDEYDSIGIKDAQTLYIIV